MKILLKCIREGLGRLIILMDILSRGRPTVRSASEQAALDQKTDGWALYQFYACPFCTKVRRHIHHLNMKIEYRDAQKQGPDRDALLNQGGKIKVPCLRVKDQWIYESNTIIQYLNDAQLQ